VARGIRCSSECGYPLTCQTRIDTVTEILKKTDSIVNDISEAVQEKNVSKIAPSNLGIFMYFVQLIIAVCVSTVYGKAVEGLKAFRRQLRNDLISELLVNEGPKLIQDAPKFLKEIITDAPEKRSRALIISRGQKVVESVSELSRDPSMLQSTIDEVRKEARNIFKSTPEGMHLPSTHSAEEDGRVRIKVLRPVLNMHYGVNKP